MSHRFWNTQPVRNASVEEPEGMILQNSESIRSTPLSLPAEFEWELIDVSKEDHLHRVYELLSRYYVEGRAKLLYTSDFLKWVFGQKGSMCIGVKVCKTDRIVGYIFASFGELSIKGKLLKVAEIDFLCVHPKLRNKRLAPLLIQEITRRVRLQNIHCAVYTAGVELPTPYVHHTYYHRFMNVDKLFSAGFISSDQLAYADAYRKKYKILPKWHSAGLHMADTASTDLVCKDIIPLYDTYLPATVKPVLSMKLVRYLISAPPDVLQTFYITHPQTGDMVAFCMVYFLQYAFGEKIIRVAQLYHFAARDEGDLRRILRGMLAKIRSKADVLNVLDGTGFETVSKILDLTPGTGKLYGYLWNYRLDRIVPEKDAVLLF